MDAASFSRGRGGAPGSSLSTGEEPKKDSLRDQTDEELMTLWVNSRTLRTGDASPFEILWQRHRGATARLVARVLGRRHRFIVDEVLQDAWLEVARATHYLSGSFRSWIRTIATRKALDRLATASNRNVVKDDRLSRDDRAALQSSGDDPASAASAREAVAIVLEFVERMPDAQRAAWVLKYVEEMTFEELAEAMGTPVGTAKTRIRLANAFLAEALVERGITPADLEEDT
jgi:RNA polymerase sigma-70 factor, ECF subfamily